MDLSTLKKPLAALLIVSMVTAVIATSLVALNANGQQQNPWGQFGQQNGQQYGQQYGQSQSRTAPLRLPGISLPGLVQGSNNLALSVSVASQDQNKIYFLVNALAVIDQTSQAATVYQLSTALPGVMDTQTNDIQIDFGKLNSVMGSPQQASMNDLYHILRPSVNSIMVTVVATPTQSGSGQTTFSLQDLSLILPDGNQDTFNMQQSISAIYDQSSMRLYTVGFQQLYDLVNTYITNEQNNYYTTIIYNIVPAAPIVVTPGVLYPAITPIAFPAVWPVYYPVPVPVPFPTTRPGPRPSKTPTVSPTVSPTGTPTISPTVTKKPTISPTVTKKPTISPTVKPTLKPTVTVTKKPTISPTVKPTLKPTVKPSLVATAKPTYKPTVKPTVKPTYKPTQSGGKMPTAYKPIVTKKPLIQLSDVDFETGASDLAV